MSAKFAPVVPTQVAAYYHDQGMLGDYHLLLAHDVVAHPTEYHRLYSDVSRFVIMDNSVIELGHPVDLEFMRTAIGVTHANVFALPDELLDKDATIASTMKALDEWGSLITMETSAMAVPQGSNWAEWLECLEAFAKVDDIAWIGIPRNVQNKLNVSRVDAVEAVQQIAPDVQIHLLGFSKDMQDDIEAAKLEGVAGIDSAVPSRMGMRDGVPINADSYVHASRGDWWENPNMEGVDLGMSNVTTFRSWIR